MKKIILCLILSFSLLGCQKQEPYQEIEVSMSDIKTKIDNKETFSFMVIRDGCDFCDSLHSYIEETKNEHTNITLYVVDSTDFKFQRDEDTGMLYTDNEDGDYLLSLSPYFLYTPTIYCVDQGEIEILGIGFNDSTKTISLWDNESSIDFNEADTVDFWDFIA